MTAAFDNDADRRLTVETMLLAIVSTYGGQTIIADEAMQRMVGELADTVYELARNGQLPDPEPIAGVRQRGVCPAERTRALREHRQHLAGRNKPTDAIDAFAAHAEADERWAWRELSIAAEYALGQWTAAHRGELFGLPPARLGPLFIQATIAYLYATGLFRLPTNWLDLLQAVPGWEDVPDHLRPYLGHDEQANPLDKSYAAHAERQRGADGDEQP